MSTEVEVNDERDEVEAVFDNFSGSLVGVINAVIDARFEEAGLFEDAGSEEFADDEFAEGDAESGEFDSDFAETAEEEEDSAVYSRKELTALTKDDLNAIIEEDWELDASDLKTKKAMIDFILDVQEHGYDEPEEEEEPETEPEPEPEVVRKRTPKVKAKSKSAPKAKPKAKGVGRYLK